MVMRRRGPGLIRTAAVVGTATAVSGRVAHSQQQKYTAEAAQQQAAAEPPPQPAAPAGEPEYTAEIETLAQLKAQGILTEEEFQAKKKKILGI